MIIVVIYRLRSYPGFKVVHAEKAYVRMQVNASFPFLHVELEDALFVMRKIGTGI